MDISDPCDVMPAPPFDSVTHSVQCTPAMLAPLMAGNWLADDIVRELLSSTQMPLRTLVDIGGTSPSLHVLRAATLAIPGHALHNVSIIASRTSRDAALTVLEQLQKWNFGMTPVVFHGKQAAAVSLNLIFPL